MTRKKLTWIEYVAWLQGKRIVSDDGDNKLIFEDGSTAEFSTWKSKDGCATCGHGEEFKTEVIVEEPCR